MASSLSTTIESQEMSDDSDIIPWSCLPSVVLAQIYSLLSTRDRFTMSLVCRQWNEALLSANTWRRFTVHNRSFTVKQYNVLVGFHREFSAEKLKQCLERVGQHIRCLTIQPIENYVQLQSFMESLSHYQSNTEFLTSLQEFQFRYSCEARNRAGSYLHGIGQPVLIHLFNFLSTLKGVRSIALDDLLLSREHIDDFQAKLFQIFPNINKLSLRNCTSEGVPLSAIGCFSNLHTFITSPQQLAESLVQKLAENGLKILHIVQDKYTSYAVPIGRQCWNKARDINPNLRVKLICSNQYKHDILFQPSAPVSHVLYDTPHSVISPVAVWAVSDYADTLRVYGHKSLPKIHGRQVAHDRADSLILLLIENCPNLETLIIRDRISSASVLLIAKSCKNLKSLYVRRNSILARLDWSQNQLWSDEFYAWLKKSSKSITRMEEETGKILGHSWRTLTDGEYERLSDIDI